MPGDVTILEGPVTPAPIFAYRALRSIFFASPESPEHYINKENIAPISYAPSPSKSRVGPPKSPQLTPSQKRKRHDINDAVVSSPTKGILRTPGILTPRAKALREVNVKFKSVSPEVRLENVFATAQSAQPHVQDVSKASTKQLPQPRAQQQPKLQLPQPKQQPLHIAATAPMVDAAATLETYMAQTEREMKRLVKYTQKMREYARKKDTENQELKMMIAHLRRENEQLVRRMPNLTENTESEEKRTRREQKVVPAGVEDAWEDLSGPAKTVKEIYHPHGDGESHQPKRAPPEKATQAVSPALRNKNRGYVQVEVDRVESTLRQNPPTPVSRQTSLAERPRPIQPRAAPEDFGIDDQGPKQISRHGASHRSASTPTLPTKTTGVPNPVQVESARSVSATSQSANAEPDRYAAARERLRQRSMARKAGAEALSKMGAMEKENVPVVNTAPPKTSSKEQQKSVVHTREGERERVEESVFDWAGL